MTINEKEINLSNYLKSSDLIKHYDYKVDRFYKPLNIEVCELHTTLKGGGFLFSLQRTDL